MTMELTAAELRDDVIVGLMEQGYKRAEATTAVTGLPVTDFAGMFRAALESLTHARKNGRSMVTVPQEEKCGCGRLLLHRGRCMWRRDLAKQMESKAHRLAKQMESKAHRKSNATPSADGKSAITHGSLATLRVNEQQLNTFLTGLPLGDKERLAQFYLTTQQGDRA